MGILFGDKNVHASLGHLNKVFLSHTKFDVWNSWKFGATEQKEMLDQAILEGVVLDYIVFFCKVGTDSFFLSLV